MNSLLYLTRISPVKTNNKFLPLDAAVKDEDGLTPLHICARKKEKEKLKETEELIYLLALLTDVNVRDR